MIDSDTQRCGDGTFYHGFRKESTNTFTHNNRNRCCLQRGKDYTVLYFHTKRYKKKQQLGAKSQFPCSFLLLLYYFSLFLFATINGYFNRSREKLFLCLHVRVFDLVTQRSVLLWVCCRLTAVFTNNFYQLSHTVFFCMCTHSSPVAFTGKMITRWGTAEFLVKNLNVASTHLNCWM